MKRLLALLLLAVAPAFAQELPPTYVNSGNIINSTYPETYGFADGTAPFEKVGIGGVVYDPNDWDGDGAYYQFSFMPGAIIAEIDISGLQLNSLEVFITSFAFKTDCNNSIGGSCENPMGPQDWIRSRMELFTTEGLFGSYNMFNSGDGTFYSYTGAEWVGAFNYVNKYMVDLTSETAYFTSARLIVEGQDIGFWGGLYGPKIDSLNLQIEYDTALQGLDTPIAPDCTINPNDPTCIINDLIDFTDEEPVMLADTGSDNGSSDGSEVVAEEEDPAPVEEMLAEADPIVEDLVEDSPAEESLEELLAEESASEEDELDEEVTAVAAIKEMVNEEKASALSDNISKDVLGAALSVAADAVSAATAAGGESASSSTSSDSSSRSTTLTAAASETVATTTESVAATESTSETTKEESAESSAVAALDILDTGRQLGQEALSVTLALTEAAATESLSEAENIAAVSSGDSVLASMMTSIETAAAVVTEEQQVASNETTTEAVTEETVATENTEVVVAENNVEATEQTAVETVEQKEEGKEEVLVAVDAQTQQTTEIVTEQREEVVVAETTSETVVDNVEQVVAEVQSEQSSAVEFTTVEQAMEVFASNVNTQAAAEQEELENNIVQQAIASSQNNEEENRMGFAEAEAVTIASDPALANAFNVQPNTASLELLGVLGSRAEEKSDAELRAEQVVAANKEQQDAINANYMEADQSGILAAIGSETDVSAYRNAMLRDASAWYKPEDIYKGVIIRDNVRGSYFLEKGNTDTYKKMIEEQYKDE